MNKCPFCVEDIQDDAILCRFCHSRLDTADALAAESRLRPKLEALAAERAEQARRDAEFLAESQRKDARVWLARLANLERRRDPKLPGSLSRELSAQAAELAVQLEGAIREVHQHIATRFSGLLTRDGDSPAPGDPSPVAPAGPDSGRHLDDSDTMKVVNRLRAMLGVEGPEEQPQATARVDPPAVEQPPLWCRRCASRRAAPCRTGPLALDVPSPGVIIGA